MVTMPVDKGFYITSHFGNRTGGFHWGTDYGRGGGSGGYPIYAVKDGTVTRSGPASGFGRWITIDHPASNGGGETVYGHVVPEVSVGQRVREGQRIGRIDPDFNANGYVSPHLHLEWHRYSWTAPGPNRLDPATMLKGAKWPGETASSASVKPETQKATTLFGVDISNHQNGISCKRIADEGFRFCIIKATEGTWKDPIFRSHLKDAQGTDMHVAAYVYVRHEKNGREHAQALHEQLQGDTSVPVALDIEHNSGSSVAHWKSIRDEIERLGYKVILTYIPHWYWQQIGRPDLTGLPPLWTSNYGAATDGYASVIYARRDRVGWQGYGGLDVAVAVFQFTEKAQVAGWKIDANAFEGTEQDLARLFNSDTPEEGMFMALSDERQEDLAAKIDRIHHEMTHEFQSLVRDENGIQSEWRGTLAGLILQLDRKVENMHKDIAPWLVTTIDKIKTLITKESKDA